MQAAEDHALSSLTGLGAVLHYGQGVQFGQRFVQLRLVHVLQGTFQAVQLVGLTLSPLGVVGAALFFGLAVALLFGQAHHLILLSQPVKFFALFDSQRQPVLILAHSMPDFGRFLRPDLAFCGSLVSKCHRPPLLRVHAECGPDHLAIQPLIPGPVFAGDKFFAKTCQAA